MAVIYKALLQDVVDEVNYLLNNTELRKEIDLLKKSDKNYRTKFSAIIKKYLKIYHEKPLH